ncbi:MAG: hypothetical protein CL910_12330 [Deltaproteobacteria bacterium]|jgi:hypothetical protein|nr:hypothetical protein [Deltaproteobacteria bacterium]
MAELRDADLSGVEASVGRAHRFTAQEGSRLDRLFLDTLLQERPAAELLAAFEAGQTREGAFAPLRGEAEPGRSATLRVLECLDALGLLDHPVPERACAYLCRAQTDDGGWDAADEEARIEETGRTAGLLAKTPFVRGSILRRGEAFLVERWTVERVKGPSYGPILAYTHLLTQLPSVHADEILQWCGRELEGGLRLGVFSPLSVARVFLRARATALPGARIEATELVTGLITGQQADGSWREEGLHPVDATLEAVEALLRLS